MTMWTTQHTHTHTPNETFRSTWMHCNQFGNELQSVYYYQHHRSTSVFVMGRWWWWPISLRQPFRTRLMNATKTSARRVFAQSMCIVHLHVRVFTKWIFRHPICILWSICYRDVSRCTVQTRYAILPLWTDERCVWNEFLLCSVVIGAIIGAQVHMVDYSVLVVIRIAEKVKCATAFATGDEWKLLFIKTIQFHVVSSLRTNPPLAVWNWISEIAWENGVARRFSFFPSGKKCDWNCVCVSSSHWRWLRCFVPGQTI